MTTRKQALGKWGEDRAAAYLLEKGYQIIARNVRTPYGELDIVAQDGEEMVFVEVKTRSTDDFGYPEEAVDDAKAERMTDSGEEFLYEHPELPQNWRIDVVAIRKLQSGKAPEIVHLENVLF